MSDIHFFQRYSKRENVITNNTLRLLAQLYNDSPNRLADFLEGLVDGLSIDVGVSMEQQTKGESSVPDGALTQSSFKLVLETKRNASFSTNQLVRHVRAFNDEKRRILLLLTPHELDSAELENARQAVRDEDDRVIFAAVRFTDVIDLLIGEDPLISQYENDLYALVEDYQNFCSSEGLLPVDKDLMRAVPCGTTHEDNFEFGLYYCPSTRGYRRHQYIGVYFDKSVRGVGELKYEVDVDRVNGKLVGEEINQLGDDERQRIHGAMDAASKHGYSIEQGHRFFLVDRFHDTDFTKESKYGMRSAQYFNLRDRLDLADAESLPAASVVAEKLHGRSWK